MKLGRYRLKASFDSDLYYRFGLGCVTRAGDLGTEYGDARANLFREVTLLLGRRVLRLRIDWKGN